MAAFCFTVNMQNPAGYCSQDESVGFTGAFPKHPDLIGPAAGQ
jgi:hypothetical protein